MNEIMKIAAVGVALGVLAGASVAAAQQTAGKPQTVDVDIAAQPMNEALNQLAAQTGIRVVFFPQAVQGKTAPQLSGTFTPDEAFKLLLSRSNLTWRFTDPRTVEIRGLESAQEGADTATPEERVALADGKMRLAAQETARTQDTAESPTNERSRSDRPIDEIIVTAQKREQQAIDVPMSISAVSGQRLEDLGISNALELSYRVPGLVVQESSPGAQLYTLRGIGNVFGSSPLVGVYLDEVDVTGSVPSLQMDMNMYDLARVEVLRGPQGTLWGAGSVGGTLRFITNQPDLQNFGGKAEVTFFGQARGDSSHEIRGAINLPIVAEKFGLRLVGSYQDLGGWIDQPEAGFKDFNDNQVKNARLRALWRPTERFEVNATAVINRSDGGGANIANLEPYNRSITRTFIDPALDTSFSDDYDHFNLTLSYDFGPATLLSATGYTDRKRYFVDTRRLLFNFDFIAGVPGTDAFDINRLDTRNSETLTQELRLTSNGDSRLSWTTGLFMRNEDTDTNFLLDQVLGPFVLADDFRQLDIASNDSWAAFADASYAVTDRWKVGLGLRYFDEERMVRSPLVSTRSEGKFDDLSPRVYTSFAVTPDVNVYANIAQGFRSGGFNPISVVAAGGPGSYEPDNVTSYELGTKMSLAGGRLYAELSVFRSDYTDMQAVGLIPGVPENVTSNIGEARIQGIEGTFVWRALDRLTFSLTGSALDTEVVELRATATSHQVGDPLDQVADYNFSVSADYDFQWRPNTPGYFRLSFNEQGPVQWTSRSSGLLYPIGHSDTLSFLTANIGAEFRGTTVELFGRNLLDESGPSNPYGECCSIQPQSRPRVIGLRVAHQFE